MSVHHKEPEADIYTSEVTLKRFRLLSNICRRLNKSWTKCSNGFVTMQHNGSRIKVEYLKFKSFDKFLTFSNAFNNVTDLFQRTQHSFDKVCRTNVGQKSKSLIYCSLRVRNVAQRTFKL